MSTRFDTESRIAVAQATDIARELGHREVGPGHLLLGLLANPRGTAYAALWEHGIHLDTARDLVAEHHVDPMPRPDDPSEPAGSTGYAEDRDALAAIGIDLDQVREAVRTNLGDDLADGWADRPERGRGRSRGERRGRRRPHRHHDHHGNHDHHDDRQDDHPAQDEQHEGRGRGRRGPRSRRDDGPRFSRELRALLRDVRRSVLRDRADRADRADRRDRRDPGRRPTALTGARMLVALTRSDDPAVRAVLATATNPEGLRARAEAVAQPTA
jgi:hypothetical protein